MGYGNEHHGYGGYNPCCKPKCGCGSCAPSYSSGPPQVTGIWTLHYSSLTQTGTGPASCGDILPSLATTLVLTQCGKPNDVFVTATVTAGPTGPLNPGTNYVGVFHKDARGCYTLKMPSSTENTTFEFNFKGGHCPKCLNFSSSKPYESDTTESEVVAGCGEKTH